MYNLKRRIIDLPPISFPVFQTQIESSGKDYFNRRKRPSSPFQELCRLCQRQYTDLIGWQTHLRSQHHIRRVDSPAPSTPNEYSSKELEAQNWGAQEEHFSPAHCLFCDLKSSNLDNNISHMARAHSFFIQDIDYLVNIESFLGYLFTIISNFHECLFCGSVRNTKTGVQDHMKEKGHCRLNFENEEHNLKEFYDSENDEEQFSERSGETAVLEEDELRLPSGRVFGHRSRIRYFRKQHHKETKGCELSSSLPKSPSDLTDSTSEALLAESRERQLAMRAGTSTSLAGVSSLQQRALMSVGYKMMSSKVRMDNDYQNAVEKGGNRQKRYKVAGIGKKQGGLEKRLG